MGQYGPVSAFLWITGKDVSADHFQFDELVEQILEQANGLGESWERHLPVGIARVTLDAGGGFYDDRVAGINDAFQAQGSTRQVTCFGVSGVAIGNECVLMDGDYAINWKRGGSRDGLTKANALHKLTGKHYRGRILHAKTAETGATAQTTAIDNNDSITLQPVTIVSNSVANPSVVTTALPHGLTSGDAVVIAGVSGSTPTINGFQTATVITPTTFSVPVNVTVGGTGGTVKQLTDNAAVAALQVFALTLGGYTNVTIKIRHSSDNSVFVDGTPSFANVATAPVAEVISLAAGVRRYRAVMHTFNGAGSGMSITYACAISHSK